MAKSEKPQSAFTSTAGLPSLPLFVVMRITPFAALEPYREAAAASFITVMFSMSEVFIVLIMSKPASVPNDDTLPDIVGTPSMT